ncbi:MAG TPA: flagellar biosynthesis protein FlhB [Candidatus Hydrogenedentes bacterium]|nr:flagellar biosynthesis protein FlhB [Candidatus Hydrogenedentota bacterium]HPG69365.1 flagellar biosynthesis protein FlhB [Candidatus Hydrogenedentota bacterium]
MPEQSGGEKTIPASQHKKRRAREEGNVARSQDLTSGAALLLALIAMRFLGPYVFDHLVESGRFFFGNADSLLPETGLLRSLSIEAVQRLSLCVLPFALVMLVGGLTINLLQVGVLFTAKPLTPKLERLNPIQGMQRFVTLRSLIELVKSILKLILVGYIVWLTLRAKLSELPILMELTPLTLVPALGAITVLIWWRIALAMLVLGVLDYGYQYWQHGQDLRMTVQEARQEAKELEGDPRIKARVRQIQRHIAMQRMMRQVPTADVVITNPTTYAVALRYDMANMAAPVVVAKGARLLAERIRNLAIEHSVPIVHKPELARALYRTIEVDQPVPEHLFRAIAEVLAYVYEIDRRAEKRRERKQFGRLMREAV